MNSIFKTVFFASLIVLGFTTYASAQSPIDTSSKLHMIEGEFGLADGAAWDGSWSLYIPDVRNQNLLRYIPKTKKLVMVKEKVGRISASFYQHGRLYLSDNGEQSISYFKKGKKIVVKDFKKEGDGKLRPNDLVIDNKGGIYVTFTPQNQVHYISPTGKSHIAIADVKTPNGITLSPDGSTLYVSAYRPKEIWSYDLQEPGKPGKGKKFATLPAHEGFGADGMAMDKAGNVYCTGPTGVTIWNPAGKSLGRIETPTKPINCIFGDQDMQTLFISCMGGVYSQKMKIAGLAPQPPIDEKVSFPNRNNTRPSTVLPKGVRSNLDVVYAKYNDRKMLMDLFTPADENKPKMAKRYPAVVVVHGGGWVKGDKTKFRAMAIEIARHGFVTAAIEYRLAGEALFPAAIHDCNAAVQHLKTNAADYNIDPARIGAVGGSAGGHLVGLMASGWKNPKLQGPGGTSDQSSRIAAAVVLAGPLQIATGSVAERSRNVSNSFSNLWFGTSIDQAKSTYLTADACEQIDSDTSPILFMTGELDNPKRNQLSREKLKLVGVKTDLKTYADGKHGCWNQRPWFDQMSKDIVEYFQSEL